jgi:hypothetical protein
MSKWKTLSIFTFALALFMMLSGCSNDNPTTFMSGKVNSGVDNNSPMINANTEEALIYDVAFRDTIVNIDYDNGTFTVANRSETVTTDSSTFIWLQIISPGGPDRDGEADLAPSGSAKGQPQNYIYTRDSVLQFSDLKAGYVVEVRACTIDPSTLFAGKIKVASCNYQEVCFEFDDVLASVDISSRTVTFVTETRTGTVCQNTVLTGLDGEALALSDFIPGDNVHVKGRIVADDTLKVCAMTKTE